MEFTEEEFQKALKWLEEPMTVEQFEIALAEYRRDVDRISSPEYEQTLYDAQRESIVEAYRANDWRRKSPPHGRRYT